MLPAWPICKQLLERCGYVFLCVSLFNHFKGSHQETPIWGGSNCPARNALAPLRRPAPEPIPAIKEVEEDQEDSGKKKKTQNIRSGAQLRGLPQLPVMRILQAQLALEPVYRIWETGSSTNLSPELVFGA